MTIIASPALANGLRTEFADTYMAIRNRQQDSRLANVMDLSVGATNRRHEFAYFEAAPHAEHWPRGSAIPTDSHKAIKFEGVVYNWGRRVPWHMDDRADDQTGTLFDSAKGAGESFGLLPERFFFDMLTNSAGTLPGIPLAPDGSAFFAASRFGTSGGNIIGGDGVTTLSSILTNYYEVMARYRAYTDGKGQPLFSSEQIDQGVTIIFGAHLEQIMDEAFRQKRQTVGITAAGVPATASVVTAGTPSNVVHDSSRNIDLWPTSRISTGNDDWFIFLKGAPKKSTFLMDREGIVEASSLMSDNNSDHTRTTGEEYIQWHSRQGAGISLPYGAIQVNN